MEETKDQSKRRAEVKARILHRREELQALEKEYTELTTTEHRRLELIARNTLPNLLEEYSFRIVLHQMYDDAEIRLVSSADESIYVILPDTESVS